MLELTFGYNDLGRIFGSEGGAGRGDGSSAGGPGGGLDRGVPGAYQPGRTPGGGLEGAPTGAGVHPPGGTPGSGVSSGSVFRGGEFPGGGRGGGGPGGSFGGQAGITRMFADAVGAQAGWCRQPLLLLLAGLWLVRRIQRTDRLRASLLLWGAWTVVTALVFSFAQGIFHPYYTGRWRPGSPRSPGPAGCSCGAAARPGRGGQRSRPSSD